MDLEHSSLRLKVDKASQDGTTDLCPSCVHATVAVMRNNSEARHCGYMERAIDGPVAKCSKYYSSTAPSLRGMEDIAWILRTDKKRVVGFMTPQAYKRMQEEEGTVAPPSFNP